MFYSLGHVNNAWLFPWQFNPFSPGRAQISRLACLLNCCDLMCRVLHVEAMAILLLFVANSLGGNFSADKSDVCRHEEGGEELLARSFSRLWAQLTPPVSVLHGAPAAPSVPVLQGWCVLASVGRPPPPSPTLFPFVQQQVSVPNTCFKKSEKTPYIH